MRIIIKEYYTYRIGKEKKKDTEAYKQIAHDVIFLYRFAVYLAHISNGAPKKITIYFEKYVIKKDEEDKYYLQFRYRHQRKIGFIYYMVYPLFNTIVNNTTQYNDKLLISACFLINHIYKYHNNSFSWRNLENIPELLEINRTPEMRSFVHNIISFLNQSHLYPIISGLYNFKIPMKLSEEISIMSKFHAEVSALFNFTLDDSLSLQKHYLKLLKYYESGNKQTGESPIPHSKTISDIRHILGDLHLFNEEYNEAVFEYQNCIQELIRKNSREPNRFDNPEDFMEFVRVTLKLGLANEKRHTNNVAYAVYNELISKLMKFRHITKTKLGLDYMEEVPKEKKDVKKDLGKKSILYRTGNTDYHIIPEFQEEVMPLRYPEDKKSVEFGVYSEDLTELLLRQITPVTNEILTRLSLFDDVRLVYQALLAKLFVMEKMSMTGITKAHIDTAVSQFEFLHKFTNAKEKFMISADFYRKLGNILYYKNGLIDEDSSSFFMGMYFWGYNVEKDLYDYCYYSENENKEKIFKNYPLAKKMIYKFEAEVRCGKYCDVSKRKDCIESEDDIIITNFFNSDYFRLKKMFEINTHKTKPKICIIDNDNKSIKRIVECNKCRKSALSNEKKRSLPCYACNFYKHSLEIMAKNLFGKDNIEELHNTSKAIYFLEKMTEKQNVSNTVYLLASSLNVLGNTLLSCADSENKIEEDFMNRFINYVRAPKSENWKNKGGLSNIKTLSNIEKAILYYWTAAIYYKFSSNQKDAFLCYKKIIEIFISYIKVDKDRAKKIFSNENLRYIRKIIFRKALKNIYTHYENTNMVELQKLKFILDKKNEMYEVIPFHILSLFPDVEEFVILYYELKILCDEYNVKDFKKIYQSDFLSKYRMESTVYERVIALRFKAFLNMQIIHKIIPCFPDSIYEDDGSIFEKFFGDLHSYLIGLISMGNFYHFFEDKSGKNVPENRLKLLEFLIEDSIFCLSKIFDIISPVNQTTLFTDSYIGEIYNMFLECNWIYELLYKTCKYVQPKNDDIIKNGVIDDIYKIRKHRYGLIDELKYKKRIEESLEELIYFADDFSTPDDFSNELLKTIDVASTFFNNGNYLAETALKKYRRAREIHWEGSAYKEFISGMYFLDDDLSNDTCQHKFAVERYLNNCDYIDRKIDRLKKLYKNTTLYQVSEYTNTFADLNESI